MKAVSIAKSSARDRMATPVGATGSKVRFADNPSGILKYRASMGALPCWQQLKAQFVRSTLARRT
jgi:hypothetical protein